MKIILKKLNIRNFKGIRAFEASFAEKESDIFGANATGKTTLMDAFLWLFFGKDSSDRKDFNIKTLDKNNKPYHKLEHEVSGIIEVDGQDISLKKIYKEKWVKKRGETTAEFSGHDTSYYWNEVPMQQKEFDRKISNLFNENVFRLITNTTYFNSLKWQDRRTVLLLMAGHISDSEVLTSISDDSNKAQTDLIVSALSAGKSIDEYRKEIAVKKKKLKDDLILIPSRIDEVNRTMPEQLDYEGIEARINELSNDIDVVDGVIVDKARAYKEAQNDAIKLMQKKQNVSKTMMDIEFEEKSKVQERKRDRELNIQNKKRELEELNDKLTRSRKEYIDTKKEIDSITANSDALRTRWHEVNNSAIAFNDDEFCCPTCKREYPIEQTNDKKVEMTENFNKNKSEQLAAINVHGLDCKNRLQELNTKLGNLEAAGALIKDAIENMEQSINDFKAEHSRLSVNEDAELEKAIAGNAEYKNAKSELDALALEIDKSVDVEDNTALLQRKKELQIQIDKFKSQLSSKALREKQTERLRELQIQEENWNQDLANLEGLEFTIASYTRAKMNMLEERINGKFKIVTFKMFEDQINGGQVEACTTLINGVPYPDVNTAGKIQAGLDIINALSDHYNIYGPIWVDNRESVTELPETKSQLINLIVSPEHKDLTLINDIEILSNT